MSSDRFDSVWDAIEDTPAQGENMRLRSPPDDGAEGIAVRGVAGGGWTEVAGVRAGRAMDGLRVFCGGVCLRTSERHGLNRRVRSVRLTPLPDPPPQGGREKALQCSPGRRAIPRLGHLS